MKLGLASVGQTEECQLTTRFLSSPMIGSMLNEEGWAMLANDPKVRQWLMRLSGRTLEA